MKGIITTGKILQNGSEIKFTTNDNVSVGNKFKTTLGERNHYYESISIELGDNNNFVVQAKEVGYWARKLNKITNFDLRTIVGAEVEQITEESELKKLYEASCWC